MGYLSATDEGKAYDQILPELESSPFRPGSCLSQDRGFPGYPWAGITIVQ
jgi:hypothetical protein